MKYTIFLHYLNVYACTVIEIKSGAQGNVEVPYTTKTQIFGSQPNKP